MPILGCKVVLNGRQRGLRRQWRSRRHSADGRRMSCPPCRICGHRWLEPCVLKVACAGMDHPTCPLGLCTGLFAAPPWFDGRSSAVRSERAYSTRADWPVHGARMGPLRASAPSSMIGPGRICTCSGLVDLQPNRSKPETRVPCRLPSSSVAELAMVGSQWLDRALPSADRKSLLGPE